VTEDRDELRAQRELEKRDPTLRHVEPRSDHRSPPLLECAFRFTLDERAQRVGRVPSRGDLSGDEVAASPSLAQRAEAAGVLDRPRATSEPVADVVARAVLRLARGDGQLWHYEVSLVATPLAFPASPFDK
jgi:hypothetical protein